MVMTATSKEVRLDYINLFTLGISDFISVFLTFKQSVHFLDCEYLSRYSAASEAR